MQHRKLGPVVGVIDLFRAAFRASGVALSPPTALRAVDHLFQRERAQNPTDRHTFSSTHGKKHQKNGVTVAAVRSVDGDRPGGHVGFGWERL